MSTDRKLGAADEASLAQLKNKISGLVSEINESKIEALLKLADQVKGEDQVCELEKGFLQIAENMYQESVRACESKNSKIENSFAANLEKRLMLLAKEEDRGNIHANRISYEIVRYQEEQKEDNASARRLYNFYYFKIKALRALKKPEINYKAMDELEYKMIALHADLKQEFKMAEQKRYFDLVFNNLRKVGISTGKYSPLCSSYAATVYAKESKQDLTIKNNETETLAERNYAPTMYMLATHFQAEKRIRPTLVQYANLLVLLSGFDTKKSETIFGVSEDELNMWRENATVYIKKCAEDRDCPHRVFARWLQNFIAIAARKNLDLMNSFGPPSMGTMMLSAMEQWESIKIKFDPALQAQFAGVNVAQIIRDYRKGYTDSIGRPIVLPSADTNKIVLEKMTLPPVPVPHVVVVEVPQRVELKQAVNLEKQIFELLAKPNKFGIEGLIKLAEESKSEAQTREVEQAIATWKHDFFSRYLYSKLWYGAVHYERHSEIITSLVKKEHEEKNAYVAKFNREFEQYFEKKIADKNLEKSIQPTRIADFYRTKRDALIASKAMPQEIANAERQNISYLQKSIGLDQSDAIAKLKLLSKSGYTQANRSFATTILAQEEKQDLTRKNNTTVALAKNGYAPAMYAVAKHYEGASRIRPTLVQYANLLILLANYDNKEAAAVFQVSEYQVISWRQNALNYIQKCAQDRACPHRLFANWLAEMVNIANTTDLGLMESNKAYSVHELMLSVILKMDDLKRKNPDLVAQLPNIPIANVKSDYLLGLNDSLGTRFGKTFFSDDMPAPVVQANMIDWLADAPQRQQAQARNQLQRQQLEFYTQAKYAPAVVNSSQRRQEVVPAPIELKVMPRRYTPLPIYAADVAVDSKEQDRTLYYGNQGVEVVTEYGGKDVLPPACTPSSTHARALPAATAPAYDGIDIDAEVDEAVRLGANPNWMKVFEKKKTEPAPEPRRQFSQPAPVVVRYPMGKTVVL